MSTGVPSSSSVETVWNKENVVKWLIANKDVVTIGDILALLTPAQLYGTLLSFLVVAGVLSWAGYKVGAWQLENRESDLKFEHKQDLAKKLDEKEKALNDKFTADSF